MKQIVRFQRQVVQELINPARVPVTPRVLSVRSKSGSGPTYSVPALSRGEPLLSLRPGFAARFMTLARLPSVRRRGCVSGSTGHAPAARGRHCQMLSCLLGIMLPVQILPIVLLYCMQRECNAKSTR